MWRTEETEPKPVGARRVPGGRSKAAQDVGAEWPLFWVAHRQVHELGEWVGRAGDIIDGATDIEFLF